MSKNKHDIVSEEYAVQLVRSAFKRMRETDAIVTGIEIKYYEPGKKETTP